MTTKLNILLKKHFLVLILFSLFIVNSSINYAQTFSAGYMDTGADCNWPYSSVTTNSAGEIYGIWRDGTGASYEYKLIKHNPANNTWSSVGNMTMAILQAQTEFDQVNDGIQLIIDGTGKYHILFSASEIGGGCCSQKRGLVYGTSTNGTTWTLTQLVALTDPSGWKNIYDPVFKLNSSSRPHVVYTYNDVNGTRIYNIEHRWFDGSSWQHEVIVNQAGNASNEVNYPDLSIAPNGDLNVACIRETNGTGLDGSLWHYVKSGSGSWVGTELLHGSGSTPASVNCSINVLPSGIISILNYSNFNGVTTEVTNASGSWQNNVIGGGLAGSFSFGTFSTNSNGDKFFAYTDNGTYNTYKYAKKFNGDANWTINGNIYNGPAGSGVANFSSAVMTNSKAIVTLFTYHPDGDCSVSSPRQIWSAYAPGVASTTITDQPDNVSVCAGTNTSFSVTATDATGYQWQVNTGSGFTNITNGGVYSNATTSTLNITGATAGMNGYQYRCVVSGTPSVTSNNATLTVNSAPSITGNPPNRSICSGSNTTFPITAINATGYQWQVNTGSGFTNISNGAPYSGATTATLTITGATFGMNGYTYRCIATGSCTPAATSNVASLTVSSTISGTTVVTNVSCNGGSNGAIDLTPTGGIPGYTYSWNGGATTQDRTGLAAGTYTVTITDAIGCTGTVSATVVEPSLLTANTNVTPVSCNGGSNGVIDLTPGGGISPYTYMWSTGSTNQDISGLSAGIYTVTVTDQNGCTRVASATVTQPGAPLSGSTVVTDVSCNGGSNGTIDLTPAGGTTPYTYNWGGGITTQDRTGLSIGTYTVTITDFRSCTAITSATVGQPATSVSGSTTGTNVSCFGGSNGTIDLTPAGGTPGYTYNWGGGITTQDRTGLAAGTYTVTITDANGCTAVVSHTVNQPGSVVSGTTIVTNIPCFGGTSGAIDLTPTGGTPGYTYNWGGGITTQDRTGLSAGTYTVTITDANACTGVVFATVTQPLILSGSTSVTNVSCFGGSNGAINLTPQGGQVPYTFNWGGGITSEDRTGLTAGTYEVTITDANLCTVVVSATVNQPTAPVMGTTVVTNVSCFGGSNGAINLTPAGGTPGYTYLWSNGVTVQDPTGLSAGSYTVTITDTNGCTAVVSATVGQPGGGLSVIPSQTNVLCNGACNGTATVTVSGGTPGYTYLWSPSGGTAATASGLCAGAYTCFITDVNGCTITQSFTITEPAVLTSTSSQVNILCFGSSTGSATVHPTGGTLNYSYLWSPVGGTAATASGLTAGNYSCLITDANGCTYTQFVTITQPPALASSIVSQTNVTCHSGSDGSVTISVTGGTGAYTYLWSPSGGTGATASGLSAGTYTCLITDANLCTITQTVIITQPDPVVVGATATPNPICNAGTLTLGVTSSVTYSWTGPNNFTSNIQNPIISNVSALNAGTYNVSITDAAGCLNIGSVNVVVNPTPDVVATPSSQTICSAASITTMVMTGSVAGTTYAWSRNNTASVTGISASGSGNISGTLTNTTSAPVTVTFTITPTASGCPGPAITATVLVNPTPNAVATPSAQTICSGANINPIVLSGNTTGTTYTWTRNNTANVSGIAASGSGNISGSLANFTSAPITVTFTITPSANGCTGNSITATVTVNPNPVVTIGATPNPVCISSNLYLSASGGASYTWTGPAGFTSNNQNPIRFISNLDQAGSYNVKITSAEGCISNGSVTVVVNPLPVATVNVNDPVCFGSNIQLGATGGVAYNWSGPLGFNSNVQNPVISNAAYTHSGEYYVTVTNVQGCNIRLVQKVNVLAAPVIKTSYDQSTACEGNNLALYAETQGVVVWNGPNGFTSTLKNPVINNVSNLNSGIYTVVVTGPNGCTSSSSLNVTINPLPVLTVSASNYEMCQGATVQLFASVSGLTYKWSGPSGYSSNQQNPVITNIPSYMSGTYYLEVRNASGCKSIYTLELNVYPTETGSAYASPDNVCVGGTLELFASEGGSYLWLGPNGFISYDQNPVIYNITEKAAGEYHLIIYSKGGCGETYITLRVNVILTPGAIAFANPNPAAENSQVSFFSSPGVSHSWTGPLGFTSNQQNPVIRAVNRYQAGLYIVDIENENGCISTGKVTLRVTFSNGKFGLVSTDGAFESVIDSDLKLSQVNMVHPNPTNDQLFFGLQVNERIEYSVFNAMGKMIINGQKTGESSFSTSQLPAGVYHVVFKPESSQTWITNRFVKIN